MLKVEVDGCEVTILEVEGNETDVAIEAALIVKALADTVVHKLDRRIFMLGIATLISDEDFISCEQIIEGE